MIGAATGTSTAAVETIQRAWRLIIDEANTDAPVRDILVKMRTRRVLSPARLLVPAVLLFAGSGAAHLGLIAPLRGQSSTTVWDGVFTGAQAERGQSAYRERCQSCHGEKLEGGVGPALAG